MCIFADSDIPNEMPHNASEKEVKKKYFEIIICDPSIGSMNHPKITVSDQKEESMSA